MYRIGYVCWTALWISSLSFDDQWRRSYGIPNEIGHFMGRNGVRWQYAVLCCPGRRGENESLFQKPGVPKSGQLSLSVPFCGGCSTFGDRENCKTKIGLAFVPLWTHSPFGVRVKKDEDRHQTSQIESAIIPPLPFLSNSGYLPANNGQRWYIAFLQANMTLVSCQTISEYFPFPWVEILSFPVGGMTLLCQDGNAGSFHLYLCWAILTTTSVCRLARQDQNVSAIAKESRAWLCIWGSLSVCKPISPRQIQNFSSEYNRRYCGSVFPRR